MNQTTYFLTGEYVVALLHVAEGSLTEGLACTRVSIKVDLPRM